MNTIDPRLLDTAETFRTAMLTTLSPEGALQSRPMTLAGRDGNSLWFATTLTNDAAEDVAKLRMANVTFQGTLLYLSVTGDAELSADPQKIKELWNDTWAAWFPNGPTDSQLVLIRVDVTHGDIWDMRGKQGLKAAFDMATSAVSRRLGFDGDAALAK
jgi:general stress protein 26